MGHFPEGWIEDNLAWMIAQDVLNYTEHNNLIEYVLDNSQFKLWTASPAPHVHHYGTSGLITHTLEVVQNCIAMAEANSHMVIDMEVLVLSAIWHDFGKIWDYEPVYDRWNLEIGPETSWKSTDQKDKIYHISRSAIEWNKVCAENNIPTKLVDEVTHCILSHHNLPEWKSPRTPQTNEAWILHLADMLSARLNDVNKKEL